MVERIDDHGARSDVNVEAVVVHADIAVADHERSGVHVESAEVNLGGAVVSHDDGHVNVEIADADDERVRAHDERADVHVERGVAHVERADVHVEEAGVHVDRAVVHVDDVDVNVAKLLAYYEFRKIGKGTHGARVDLSDAPSRPGPNPEEKVMARSDGQPYGGLLKLDLSKLAGILFDLPAGVLALLNKEHENVDDALKELDANVPQSGAACGVPDDAYQQVRTCTDNINRIRAARADVAKLLEVLDESEAKFVHERERGLSRISKAVRDKAHDKDDPTLLAPFQKVIAYVAQIAKKAVATREKNKAAAKAAKGKPDG
jgi:hypothetical protein